MKRVSRSLSDVGLVRVPEGLRSVLPLYIPAMTRILVREERGTGFDLEEDANWRYAFLL